MNRTILPIVLVYIVVLTLAGCGPWLSTGINSDEVAADKKSGSDVALSSEPKTGENVNPTLAPVKKIDKSNFRLAPELKSDTWLNGQPTSLAELRGQVVLVDFWTFG